MAINAAWTAATNDSIVPWSFGVYGVAPSQLQGSWAARGREFLLVNQLKAIAGHRRPGLRPPKLVDLASVPGMTTVRPFEDLQLDRRSRIDLRVTFHRADGQLNLVLPLDDEGISFLREVAVVQIDNAHEIAAIQKHLVGKPSCG